MGVYNGGATIEHSMMVSQKIKIELPYDPAILLLGIYPEELKAGSQRDNCMSMIIASLFTIAQR